MSNPDPGTRTDRRPGPPWWLEVLVYVGIAVATIAPALGSPDRLAGDGVDLYGTIWFFWWIRDCIEHLRDPSWTDLFFYPHGKDIFAHTGNNFVDAVLATPLQWLIGNPGYYKWWVAIVLIGNALAFRVLARGEIRDRWAAFGATALFTVNPYVIYELQCGRPTQAMLWWLPLAYWALLRVDRSVGTAVLCGAMVALTGWTYWFYGFFFAFTATWLVGLEGGRRWRSDRASFRRWARNLAIAIGVAAIGVAPAVLAMGSRHVSEGVPGVQELQRAWFDLPTSGGHGLSPALHGYILLEPSGPRFFHQPLWGLLLAAWVLFGRGRSRWLGVLAIGLVIATGTVVEWGDQTWRMFHYLVLYNGVPFFDRLWFPYRVLSICFLAVSLGAGFLLQRLFDAARARVGVARGHALVVGASTLMFGASIAGSHVEQFWPMVARDVPLPAAYRWMSEQGGGIIDLPRGITQTYIVHQTRHGLPLFGGMGENVALFWPDGYRGMVRNKFVGALTRAGRQPLAERTFDELERERIVKLGYRWVVLHRELVDSEFNRHALELPANRVQDAPFLVQDRLISFLGDPVAIDGPMVVWSLDAVDPPPDELRPTPDTLGRRTWERPEPLPYEARLFELGRIE